MDARDEIEALARDRSSGASEIAARALDALRGLAPAGQQAVLDAGLRLVRAHPAMAPLLNLVSDALAAMDHDGPAGLARLAAEREARAAALAGHGAALLRDAATVVTYSRSGSVLAALAAVARDGRALRVVVSECRPGDEGVGVARALADAGIRVTLTTDAALFGRVADADLVLVGADALCLRGIVNKAGTAALARTAVAAEVPLYVLAATDKVLPAAVAEAPALDAQGALDLDLPAGVRVEAPLFELAPYEDVTRIVTEDGPVAPARIVDAVRARRVDARILAALAAGATTTR